MVDRTSIMVSTIGDSMLIYIDDDKVEHSSGPGGNDEGTSSAASPTQRPVKSTIEDKLKELGYYDWLGRGPHCTLVMLHFTYTKIPGLRWRNKTAALKKWLTGFWERVCTSQSGHDAKGSTNKKRTISETDKNCMEIKKSTKPPTDQSIVTKKVSQLIMLDGSNPERFAEGQQNLMRMLKAGQLRDSVLVVAATKHVGKTCSINQDDARFAMKKDEVHEQLCLHHLTRDEWSIQIQATCCTGGDELCEGFNWILNEID